MTGILKGSLLSVILATGFQVASPAYANDQECIGSVITGGALGTVAGAIISKGDAGAAVGGGFAGSALGAIIGCDDVKVTTHTGRPSPGQPDWGNDDWRDDDWRNDDWREDRRLPTKSDAVAWAKLKAYKSDRTVQIDARGDILITVKPGRWVDRKCRMYTLIVDRWGKKNRSKGVMCLNRRGQIYEN